MTGKFAFRITGSRRTHRNAIYWNPRWIPSQKTINAELYVSAVVNLNKLLSNLNVRWFETP